MNSEHLEAKYSHLKNKAALLYKDYHLVGLWFDLMI